MAGKKIPQEKVQAVKKLASELVKAKAVMLVSVKNLPAAQFQKMKKELRGKADIRVAKKTALIRAIDETKIAELEGLKKYIKEDCAVLTSDDNAFELSGWFIENRSPIAAKEGQIAEDNIMVEEGPTDLVPGPVISELGALGLQIMVEDGKITIRKSKIAIKKGEKVTSGAASIFQKLGIKPFMIGITPLAFYDATCKKIFVDVKIDKRKTMEDFIQTNGRALALAVSIGYPSKATLGFLLAKASGHANALSKLQAKTA